MLCEISCKEKWSYRLEANIFKNQKFDKRFISRTHKELLKLKKVRSWIKPIQYCKVKKIKDKQQGKNSKKTQTKTNKQNGQKI